MVQDKVEIKIMFKKKKQSINVANMKLKLQVPWNRLIKTKVQQVWQVNRKLLLLIKIRPNPNNPIRKIEKAV